MLTHEEAVTRKVVLIDITCFYLGESGGMVLKKLWKCNGGKATSQHFIVDGTPYEVKISCTVWSGGKGRDNFKSLPIAIKWRINKQMQKIREVWA